MSGKPEEGPGEAGASETIKPRLRTEVEARTFSFVVEKTTAAEQRERTRDRIASYLIGILGGAVIATFVFAFLRNPDDAIEIAQTVLPVITTLVGAVLGYYFGTEHEREHGERQQ